MVAKYRIVLTLFLLLGNLQLFSLDGVRIDILPGFSGSFNAGYWIPLNILIESDIPPFDAVMEASIPIGGIHRADRGSYTIVRKVSIVPGTVLRILCTIPLERREELSVRLMREAETVIERSFTLNPFGDRGKTLLLLSRKPDLGIPSAGKWLSLSAHPEALPAAPEGYSSITAVIIHDAPLNEISPVQINALTSWIRGGGLLIVTGGLSRPGLLSSGLTDLFPYALHGRGNSLSPPALALSEKNPLPGAPSYPLWLGELKSDAEPLAPNDGDPGLFPLEASRSEGRGRIAACLIDPAAGPYRGWDAIGEYWELLLGEAPDSPREYPLTDPLPDLHAKLLSRLPGSGRSPRLTGGLFLVPLLPLLILAFLKRPPRGWLPLALLLPAAAAAIMVLLLPEERPVYREISIIKGSYKSSSADFWIKGGITSRSGGDFTLPLGDAAGLVLPNRDENLILLEHPPEIFVSRNRWESREFFIGLTDQVPIDIEVSRDGNEVSGFLRWLSGGAYRDVILLGGERAAEKVVLLPESGGLSFRAVFSAQSSALEKEAEYIKESVIDFTPVNRGYLDYLMSSGLLPREGGADFYLLLFSGISGTHLNPRQTENIGIRAVLLEFTLEEIPGEN